MTTFLNKCAFLLQEYGVSYLRGAGTTLLLALVGTLAGCLIGFAVGTLQTIPIDPHRDPLYKRIPLCGRCGCCCGATSNCSAAPP